jgi:hypothetical protein
MAIITWPGLPSAWWIELDLPTEWTRVSDCLGELKNALEAYNERHPDRPLSGFDELLMWWWLAAPDEPQRSIIELAGREAPLLSSGLETIDLLPDERWPFFNDLWFDFQPARLRLEHLRSGTVWYDLHIRLSPDVVRALGLADNAPLARTAMAPVPTPMPAASSPIGTNEARADLLYRAALPHAGAKKWTAEQARDNAREVFQGDPLLGELSRRVYRRAWAIARTKLPKLGKL